MADSTANDRQKLAEIKKAVSGLEKTIQLKEENAGNSFFTDVDYFQFTAQIGTVCGVYEVNASNAQN